MTRVLYVHSSAGRYGADRQLELLARAVDVEAVALLPFEGPLADDLRAAGAEVLIGPLAVLRRELLSPTGLGRLARDVGRAGRGVAKLVRERGIDVVHGNTSVILGLRGAGVPLVTHVREIYPPTPVAWPLHRRSILAADRVVCVSEATRRPLGDHDHVRVVHDGLAVDPQRAPKAAARAALGLREGAFVVAVLGRISAWKGQEVLARALAEPALAERGAVGLVAGDVWPGQEQHEAALRAAGAAAGDRLRLAGFRDDVDNVYGAADVVVVPSTQPDPLPNSAIEAAAAGCCVVAADHGGLPEIVRDGQTGRLVPPGDHRALAGVLAELAGDVAQRDRLGRAAAAHTRERFAPARFAAQMLALYRELR